MTIIFSKKCEYGLQACLYLATLNSREVIPSGEIAKKLKIPKEFISKILQSLTSSGLIFSKKGKLGGFSLAKNPNKIKLIDIVTAIDGLQLFEKCVLGFPNCGPDAPCPVHKQWGQLRTKTYQMLTDETLDAFTAKTLRKIKSL